LLAIVLKLLILATDQNSVIAVRFINPYFLKRSNNLATTPRFHGMALNLTLNDAMSRKYKKMKTAKVVEILIQCSKITDA